MYCINRLLEKSLYVETNIIHIDFEPTTILKVEKWRDALLYV